MATLLLNVQLENGRKHTAEVGPKTALQSVVNEVCAKFKLNPRIHGLRNGKKDLDSACQVQFSGLTNHAKLDLMEIDSALSAALATGKTTVVLQVDGGKRLKDVLPSTTSLWNVLRHFDSQGENFTRSFSAAASAGGADSQPKVSKESHGFYRQPVVVYTRSEFGTLDELTSVTLSSLGLHNSSGALRLRFKDTTLSTDDALPLIEAADAYRAPSPPPFQEPAPAPAPAPAQASSQTSTAPQRATATATAAVGQPAPVYRWVDRGDFEQQQQQGTTASATPGAAVASAVATAYEEDSDAGWDWAARGSNTNQRPPPQRHQQQLTPLEAALRAAQQAMMADGGWDWTDKKGSAEDTEAVSFQNFKFPERPVVSELEPPAATADESAAMDVEPAVACDRKPVVYYLPDGALLSAAASAELPAEFYEVTMEDVRSMMHDIKATVKKQETLMTKTLREKATAKKYDRGVVRICFPDRTILQGQFNANEKFSAIYDFVRSYLSDPSVKFSLFTSPPRRNYGWDETLATTRLLPCAVVRFGGGQEQGSAGKYLRDDVRASAQPLGGRV